MKGRIGISTQFFTLFGWIKGYNKRAMEIYSSILKASENEIAMFRLEILDFAKRYSVKEACDLFGVSRATIFRWKKALKEKGGSLSALIPSSRAPKNKRQRSVPEGLETFIREYRGRHHGIGKEELKPVCDAVCFALGFKTVSESTIGRIIADLKKRGLLDESKAKLSLDGRSGNLHERKQRPKIIKLRRKGYVPENPGDLIEIDTISLFKDGIKRYIITAVDLKSRFAFAYCYKTLSSLSAKDFMKKLQTVLPFEIKRVQTDNGQEFHKHFMKYLEDEEKTTSLHTRDIPKAMRTLKGLTEPCVNNI
ncbi:MAG: helix-turn-helix domain-containing protein [Acidobacteriota bacterium]